MKTDSGDIKIDELIVEVKSTTTSGDTNMSVKDLIYPMLIKSTSGEVLIDTKNEPKNVKFKVHSNSGDINILDEFEGSTNIGQGTTLVELIQQAEIFQWKINFVPIS